MRLLIYCDFPYRQQEGRTYAEQAFSVFLGELAEQAGEGALIGRLDPLPGRWHFELPEAIGFVALPHYRRLSEPLGVLAATGRSATRFWQALDHADTALLFGPNPLALLFAALALARRRHVALGIRQDYIAYVRNRHPGKRWMHAAARLLDVSFRLLARRSSVVAVGSRQAQHYARARRLLALNMTLVGERDVVDRRAVLQRLQTPKPRPAAATAAVHDSALDNGHEDELTVLSVGRLDNEKNPLLLAEVLAELCAEGERRWRLIVCGEGPLQGALRARLRERGVAEHATLRGFVPMGPELCAVYRQSDLLLHTSHTEGVPQVLYEAFAAGLPVVATDVGGVASASQDAALLVPPGDAHAAAEALRRLANDRSLCDRQVTAGLRIAREHTREAQCERLVAFLSQQSDARHDPTTSSRA